jgi:hypothetical protein
METLTNLESFVRGAETSSFSAAADAFLLTVGHCALVTTACPIFYKPSTARSSRARLAKEFASASTKVLPKRFLDVGE